MNNQSYKPNLLILSDDPTSLGQLQDFFLRKGFQTHGLLPHQSLQQFLRSQPVQLVLLDIKIQEKNEFYWLKKLKAIHPQLPVIILSEKEESVYCINALKSGADDYIRKPADPREILARVKLIIKHPYQYLVNNIFEFADFLFDFEQETYKKQDSLLDLTPKESELLLLLCQNQNQLLTREYLAENIIQKKFHPLDRHIDVHINHLRKKIEQNPKIPQYIRTVWGKGYIFSMPEASVTSSYIKAA